MLLVPEQRPALMMLEPDDVRDWMGGPMLRMLHDARGAASERSGWAGAGLDGTSGPLVRNRPHPALYLEPLLMMDPCQGPMWCENEGVLSEGYQEWTGVDGVREARYGLVYSVAVPHSAYPSHVYRLERPSMYVLDDPYCLDCGARHCGGDCCFPGLLTFGLTQ